MDTNVWTTPCYVGLPGVLPPGRVSGTPGMDAGLVPVAQAGAQQHVKTHEGYTANAKAKAQILLCCSNPEQIWSYAWLMAAESLCKQPAVLLLFTLFFRRA